MNMDKRLDNLEKQFSINREADYELEQTVDLDDEMQTVVSYAKIRPSDGLREDIDYYEAKPG